MRTAWFYGAVLSLLISACGGGADGSSLSRSNDQLPLSSSENGAHGSGTSTATDIRFENIRNIEADANGNLYLIDGPFEAARIRQIAADGTISTLLDEGSNIGALAVTPVGDVFYSTVGGSLNDLSERADTVWRIANGTPTEFASDGGGMVQRIAVDPRSNTVYISSTRATIRKITADGTVTPVFSFEQGGLINDLAFRGDSLWIIRAHMPLPSDIYRWTEARGAEEWLLNSVMPFNSIVATDTALYLTKSGFSRFSGGYTSCMIERYDLATGALVPVAGNSGTCGYQDGTGESATFNVIDSITQGAAGNLYLTDPDNEVIRRVTPEGQVSLFAGRPVESAN